MQKSAADRAAKGFLLIGALNWGAVAVARFDVIAFLFGRRSPLSRLLYGAIGISGLYSLGRALGPTPKREKRLKQVAGVMDQIDEYMSKLDDYKSRIETGAKKAGDYTDKARQYSTKFENYLPEDSELARRIKHIKKRRLFK